MTGQELTEQLRSMYESAAKGEMKTMIHLFGIKYSDEIASCGVTPEVLAKRAINKTSYGTEIRVGVRLAKHVKLKR